MRDGKVLNGFLFLCVAGLMVYVFGFYEPPKPKDLPSSIEPPTIKKKPVIPTVREAQRKYEEGTGGEEEIDDYYCDSCSYEPLIESPFGPRKDAVDFPINYPSRFIMPSDFEGIMNPETEESSEQIGWVIRVR